MLELGAPDGADRADDEGGGAAVERRDLEAQRHAADGVICGHIHHAVIHDDYGIRYVNCGDWVESCTAVVEHHDGKFEIIDWSNNTSRRSDEVEQEAA